MCVCVYLKNINKFRYADDTTLMAESKEELKSLLMKVQEENGNSFQYSCLENPMDKHPGRLHSMESQESDMTKQLKHHQMDIQKRKRQGLE